MMIVLAVELAVLCNDESSAEQRSVGCRCMQAAAGDDIARRQS